MCVCVCVWGFTSGDICEVLCQLNYHQVSKKTGKTLSFCVSDLIDYEKCFD